MAIWPDWTWEDVSVSIAEYYVGGYWWTGTAWQSIFASHVMIAGQEYYINVSQDCTLDWLNYHFDLVAGGNTIVWEPVAIGDIIVRMPLTLTIPPSEIEDIVVTIPLTLTIPSITPPEPPEEDWQAWLEKNWPWIAVAGVGTAGVILAWPKGKRPRRKK